MLGKHYSLGSIVEETGEARIKLANFEELKTQGEDIASFLNTFSPDSGFVYLHVIAMGAGEYYGCNINGDYFPERDLIARHNTFVTHAKVFKEHDNKPHSPDYGHVAFSWYNPKMHRVELILAVDKLKGKEFIDRQARGEQLEVSMGCFPAGTKVLMSDLSAKNIEDIIPGDMVVTHKNNKHQVKTKMMYQYSGDYYELEVDYALRFKATGNHPIFTVRDSGVVCTDMRDLMLGDTVVRFLDNGTREPGIVTNITKLDDVENLTVYNLSVDTDESYVVENIAVHNCKVAFDVCSICGNKAKKSSDYCEHIRRDKKKIYPDGRQPYMINYNPTFFDISVVRRRADRIAYVLSKVASADASIANYMADEFENLGNNIPLAPEPERAVFDIDEAFEKDASITAPKSATLSEKVAMIKRINSSAVKVMDDNISALIPQLEQVEPDIPVALLDKMALKYSFPDILKAFALRAIPMKPREATRIIIVQKGLPLDSFNDVLRGLMAAKPTAADARAVLGATYRHELGSLLDDFLWSRSSFLPAVLDRIQMLQGREKRAAAFKLDPIQSYLELNPRLAFGHVRRELPFQDVNGNLEPGHIAVIKDSYATTPVQVSAQTLERDMRRPQLKDPVLNPFQTAMLMGGAYLAYKDSDFLKNLVNSPQGAAILAAIAAMMHTKARIPSVNAMQTKVAGIATDVVGKIVLPFVGAHFAAAHFRNRYNNGYELNAVEKLIAENPDVLSIAAPLAVHYGLRKHASVGDLPVLDCENMPGVEKLAELSDTAADVARDILSGIILNSRRRSVLSNIIDMRVDGALINSTTDRLAQHFQANQDYE